MCAVLVHCTSESRGRAVLRVGTTYTLEQSGALALLDSLESPVPFTTIVGPSGQILRAAAAGDLDVVITHAPPLEARLLVAPGLVALRCAFIASRFAIVGPARDPAQVRSAVSAAQAFQRIAARGSRFVSRGDSSGTHVKELLLWHAAGINPSAPWYIEAGVDQAATLRLAEEREAYALADMPTFTHLPGIQLHVLLTGDTALANPYTMYVVRASASPEMAATVARWMMRDWRGRLITRSGFVARDSVCTVPAPADSLGGETDAVGGSRTESRTDPHATRRSRDR